ncbi:MAG: DUF115 domain-containing protein [Gammaproteobacteria bacterium]|nr:DUF115 domain-containing protein [Gammaproteobacteria bacterium]
MASSPIEPDIATAPFVSNAFGERYLHAVNRTAFATIGAQAVFQQHFGDKLRDEDTLNIVIGSDSGLLLEQVHRQGVPAGSRFLFIELPELLPRIQERLADLELDPRIKIVPADGWYRHAQDFSLDSYVYIDRLRLLNSVGAADAFLPDYRLLYRRVKTELDTWIWALRGTLKSSRFIDCQLVNAAQAQIPAIRLKDSFPGRTAILLGGGPSLDDILPWLKQHRRELVVFAVSRVCRRLQEEGIAPDIVCTIDPTSLSFDVSKEMLKFGDDVLLVGAYHASPPLLSQWCGRYVYLGERLPWPSDLNEPNLQVIGPTVTNTALALAMEMGFNQVILGGVDLCFSAEGYSHAAGSNERIAGPALGHMGPQIITNSGHMAETSDALQQAVNDIARQAYAAQERGCQFINPAPNAACIPNVLHRSLDAIQLTTLDGEPLNEDAREILARYVPDADATTRLGYYQRLDKEVAATERRVHKIAELAQEALHCNDGLFGRNGQSPDFKYKHKMDKIEKRLEKDFKGIADLVKHYGITPFLRVIRPDRDKAWTDAEIETTGRLYYEAYLEGTTRFLETLKTIRQRLATRLAEESATPDCLRLVNDWASFNEAGRVRVWTHQHPAQAAALPADAAAALATAEDSFRQVLESMDTAHMTRCKTEAGLSNVPSKASWLFRHKDSAGLQRLVTGLQKITAEDQAPLWLASGYLAELEGRPEDALGCYQNIAEGPALEDALRRISALSLGQADFSSALLALECLGHLSPSYLPQYAELLRLGGGAQEAADIYSRYLEQVPDDVAAMLKLGQLYQEQGIEDGARWAFTYVLERSPQNQAALSLLQSLDAVREQQA